jgi:hypothetical protein
MTDLHGAHATPPLRGIGAREPVTAATNVWHGASVKSIGPGRCPGRFDSGVWSSVALGHRGLRLAGAHGVRTGAAVGAQLARHYEVAVQRRDGR